MQKPPPDPIIHEQETFISHDEIVRSKRAVVVLMEVFKLGLGGKKAPLEMRLDIKALMGVLRKIEKL